MTITEDKTNETGLVDAVQQTFHEHRLNGPIIDSFVQGFLVYLVKPFMPSSHYPGFELGSIAPMSADFVFVTNRMHIIHLKQAVPSVEELAEKLFEFSKEFDSAFQAKHRANYRPFSTVEKARMYAREIVERLVISQPDFSEYINGDSWELTATPNHAVHFTLDRRFIFDVVLDNGNNLQEPKVLVAIRERVEDKNIVYYFDRDAIPAEVPEEITAEVVSVPTSNMINYLQDHPGLFDGLRAIGGFSEADAAITAVTRQAGQFQSLIASLH